MVQELAASLMEERKPLLLHGGLLSDAPSPFFSSTPSTFASASFSTTLPPSAPEAPLRCPRCDSPNTKFCYYNNYNLTQPRHFCKTCRRYWTKGGALRNIPIGGGCRKAKLGPASSAPATGVKPGGGGGSKANKFTPSLDTISLTRIGFEPNPELLPRPILWAASPPPPASQLLAHLRVSRGDGFPTNVTIKEEAISGGPGLGLDPLGQFMGSPWRNEGQTPFAQQQQQQQNDLPLELYQRFRPPPAETAYCSDQWIRSNGWSEPVHFSAATLATGNGSGGGCGGEGGGGSATVTSSAAAAAEQQAVLGAEFGYWNPILSWSDTPSTTN